MPIEEEPVLPTAELVTKTIAPMPSSEPVEPEPSLSAVTSSKPSAYSALNSNQQSVVDATLARMVQDLKKSPYVPPFAQDTIHEAAYETVQDPIPDPVMQTHPPLPPESSQFPTTKSETDQSFSLNLHDNLFEQAQYQPFETFASQLDAVFTLGASYAVQFE